MGGTGRLRILSRSVAKWFDALCHNMCGLNMSYVAEITQHVPNIEVTPLRIFTEVIYCR